MKQIAIKDAVKTYGPTRALDSVTLNFEENRIYGLLGRNGAGKTTLLNAITGRIFLDGGAITLDDQPCLEDDRALGQMYLMSEETLFPEKMRVAQMFGWTAAFYPGFDRDWADRTAKAFGLEQNKPVRALSTGYTSICKMIAALATGAPFIFLDEPVLGLDANHREMFYRTLVERYAERPSAIVISTHLVEEVSGLLEDVVILKQGQVIYSGQRDSLLERGYTVTGPAALVETFIAGRDCLGQDRLGGLKTAYLLGERPERAEGLEISRLDLQKLFIEMTNDGEDR